MTPKYGQKGATLIIAMIFLIIMSLFAVNAFKSSTSNLKIIGNMQARQESIAVGQKAIEETISSSLFTINPKLVADTPVSVDVVGNGVPYVARLNPVPNCFRTKAIKSTELNLAVPADLACMRSSKVEQGGLDLVDTEAGAGDSLCANSEWNLGATVADPQTGTQITLNQGVAVRVLLADAENFCN